MPSRGSRRRRHSPPRRNLDCALEPRLRVALELRGRGQLDAETALRLIVWPPAGRLEEARYVHGWAPEVREDAVEPYRSGYSLPAVEQTLGVPGRDREDLGARGRLPTYGTPTSRSRSPPASRSPRRPRSLATRTPASTAQVYAGLADDGREMAAAKLVDAGFGA